MLSTVNFLYGKYPYGTNHTTLCVSFAPYPSLKSLANATALPTFFASVGHK